MPKALGGKELCFHRFKHKIGGIDLAVGMWIGYPYHGPFVFKTEHVIDFGTLAEVVGLLLPDLDDISDCGCSHFSEGLVVGRTETDNAGNAVGTAGAVGPRRRGRGWREWTDAGVVVVKDIDATVGRVLVATDAQITGAEITRVDKAFVRFPRSVAS